MRTLKVGLVVGSMVCAVVIVTPNQKVPGESEMVVVAESRPLPSASQVDEPWFVSGKSSRRVAESTAVPDIPLMFEANVGQINSSADFVSRGLDYGVAFLRGTVALSFREHDQQDEDPPRLNEPQVSPWSLATFTVSFPGSDADVRPRGLKPLETKRHYFRGNAAAGWTINVATYSEVIYEDLYPGIDLIFYESDGRLEYDFVVQPGADPSTIRMSFAGTNQLSLSDSGDLRVQVGGQVLVHSAPNVYQNSVDHEYRVEGAFVMTESAVQFRLGEYDDSRPLVIDPKLEYSSYLGGFSGEFGEGIATDSTGGVYVTGHAPSVDFPTTPGSFSPTCNFPVDPLHCSDAFISKFDLSDASNPQLVYSTFLGGSEIQNTIWGIDIGLGIAVDAVGAAYVVGMAQSDDFPTTAGAHKEACNAVGVPDAFVTKLSPDGSSLVYSTCLGGSQAEMQDNSGAIAVDSGGRAFVTGRTASDDFPVTMGAFQSNKNTAAGFPEPFVAVLNATGTTLDYATYFGGSTVPFNEGLPSQAAHGIAVDPLGNAYVTGHTEADNFPVKNAAQPTCVLGITLRCAREAYVASFDPTKVGGNSLVFSTYLGGVSVEAGFDIAADSSGAYVSGLTASADFPVTPGSFQDPAGTLFVAKYDPAGAVVYSTRFGSGSAFAVAVDGAGRAYFGAQGSGRLVNEISNGGLVYVGRLNASGTNLQFAMLTGAPPGSTPAIRVEDLALDGAGNIYVTGGTTAGSMLVTSNALHPIYAGGPSDAFVQKVSIAPTEIYVLDGWGGVHFAGDAQPFLPASAYFGFDIAKDLELGPLGGLTTLTPVGTYVLDGFGGVNPSGGALVITPPTPYFSVDVAEDLELVASGFYVLDALGGLHPGGSAPAIVPATPYFGFDVAADLEILRTGVAVLDRIGGVHFGGGAVPISPATPYFGSQVARDIEFDGAGYYVLDDFGGVHVGGSAPALVPATPYFGFDIARDLELALTGVFVLDGYGGIHAGGGAVPITPSTPYFGFDAARDLEIR